MFEEIWGKFKSAEKILYDYFGIPEKNRNRKIENNTDSFWYIQGKSLIWANTKEDLLAENYYSLDEDDCDEAIYAIYEMKGYVAILVGCGEHTTPEMWILKLDNKISEESISQGVNMKEKLLEILKKYYNNDDKHYNRYFYDKDDNEFKMDVDVKGFFNANKIICQTEYIDCYDSCSYDCSVLSIAWIENGELFLHNVLIECM